MSGLDWRSLFTVDDVVTSLKTGKSFSFAGGGVKSGRDSAPLLGSNQGGGGAGIRDNYQFVWDPWMRVEESFIRLILWDDLTEGKTVIMVHGSLMLIPGTCWYGFCNIDGWRYLQLLILLPLYCACPTRSRTSADSRRACLFFYHEIVSVQLDHLFVSMQNFSSYLSTSNSHTSVRH